ncbi:type I polyketide synthase [Corynebacterium sp. TAE3-ERU12]|uniref:polyketide synthase Pks13 n=1 Tax=Corynebacterium sp. TAE3-ERU12 TaxID=2849491 RepID=UPI001C4886DA|nr:polyketide synthase Pks13 [Corynebacterium sp. TAE3-ERU12]MBV7296063.1 type I polyketide synthase [Corynebacterium sp. TAE3-ERU12]
MADAKHPGADFTVAQMRDWLRNWIIDTTGLTPAEVTPDRPMEELGLSSRDVVVLSGELENLIGMHLDATVAYEYPTIESLAVRLVGGDHSNPDDTAYDAYLSGVDAARNRTVRDNQLTDMDIAIVGMAARYPGADNPDEMWDMLVAGRCGTGPLPENRWQEYSGDQKVVDAMAELDLRGGYLDDITGFDAEFFGLSPVEAENMDPQQRLLLELAWEALEDAHIPASDLRGAPVGVYVGSTSNDYGLLISADPASFHPYALTGSSSSIIANRLSYSFDFRGPSIQVDTACSSSLVAIHQAVRGLRDGDADIALAGGVNLLATPHASLAFGQLGVFSSTGDIHAFSDDASGMIRGDGAGLVVLKRLEDAQRDGDDVLAVIQGSAVNSDGRSNGLTAPNPDAQVDVLRRAYADAGVDPREVDYIEAHGTGTILGDPIEAFALGTVLGRGRPADQPTLLGSAKTNFGHTEAAAGVAGVIKVVQSMRHDTLPPSLHYNGPNPYIDFDAGRLEVVEDPREWPEYSGRKIAGVSGFGFGGTNAHIVLVSPPPAPAPEVETVPLIDVDIAASAGADGAPMPALLPISGLLPSRRRAAAADLADWLDNHRNANLTDIARTLATRSRGRTKAVVRATDIDAAITGMRKVAQGQAAPAIAACDAPQAQGPVWVFSGFGSQHRTMGKDMMALSPVFRASLERLEPIVQREVGWSLLELIADDSRNYDLESAQITITAIQIAQVDMMRALGCQPAAVVGMSMGEIAAAYACDGLTAEAAMRVACARSRLMGEGEADMAANDKSGGMAMVGLSVDELDTLLAEHPEFAGVEPAVYAAPTMTTIGGPSEAIERICAYLEQQGTDARILQVKGAGHTAALDPLLGELWYECSDLAPRPVSVPLFSSVDRGVTVAPGTTVHDADYFIRCTRGSVWFAEAISRACAAGFVTFVEFAPNPVALMPIMGTAMAAGVPDAELLHLAKRKETAADSLSAAAATLYAQGHPIDLTQLTGPGRYADLPGIRWRRQRYWTSSRPNSASRAGLPGRRTVLPDGRVAYAALAEHAPSISALVDAVAADALPEATVVAVEETSPLPASGELTVLIARHPGGAAVSVYAVEGDSTSLIAEAGLSTIGAPAAAAQNTPNPAVDPAGLGMGQGDDRTPAAPGMPGMPLSAEPSGSWDPDSGESVSDHLRAIIGEAMGFEIDDLPLELPLIDLGLDSLMGMRIKNRVEHDFGIPPLQVQALRDAAVQDVITLVEQKVAEKNDAAQAAADEAPDAPDEAADTVAAEPAADAPNSQGIGVPPRDDTERLVFGTWATVIGTSAGGVTNQLPDLDEDNTRALVERLSDRVGATVQADDIAHATTIAEIADVVRPHIDGGTDGPVRVLRERPEGSTQPAVFLFHAAGGSTAVYKPLVRRLPEDVPVYGIERVEGELADRVAGYLPLIEQRADGHGIVLGGWSFGGILAYEAAHQLRAKGIEPEFIALLDTVQPADPAPQTREEMHARWDRYAAFAKKTYGLDFEVPHALLDAQGEDAMLDMLGQMAASMDSSSGMSGGVLEHQRTSFVDNRILAAVDFETWADVSAPVLLFRAERMHEGAVELEPRYATIAEDGGWSAIVKDLEIIHLNGDHLGVVDEPEIATVGERMSRALTDGV